MGETTHFEGRNDSHEGRNDPGQNNPGRTGIRARRPEPNMADQTVPSVAEFYGSKEERQLQNILRFLKPKRMANLEIETCNALKPVSFSHADVTLKQYLELLKIQNPYTNCCEEVSEYKCLGISNEQLFHSFLFCDVVEKGLKSISKEYDQIFLTILQYLRELKYHSEAIENAPKLKADETSLSAALGEHLFSQLIPGKAYFIDDTAHKKVDKCPCKMPRCNKKAEEGCTAIGLAFAWHGYADIFLDQKVPVLVINTEGESDDDKSNISEIDEEDTNYSEGGRNGENIQPPAAKKLKSSNTADIEVCLEVKNKSSRDVLLGLNVIDQIIAEAITNAFAQLNRSKCLSEMFIPTFACCNDYVIIVIYDPENDLLLQSNLIKLWGCFGELDLSAVVSIWMFLNFTHLIRPDLAKKYSFNKSRFHVCAKDMLEYYKKASCFMRFGPSDVNYYGDVVVPYMFEVMELVK